MLLALLLLQAAAPSVGGEAKPVARVHAAMKLSRTYEGIWRDAYEGQQFYDGATQPPDLKSDRRAVWLEIDRQRVLFKLLGAAPDPTIARVYRIRFIGAEAQDMDCHTPPLKGPGPYCYGHFGMFRGLVAADKILSIEDLGPLPAR